MPTLGRIALHILAHCTCEYQPRVLCTCSRPCFNILRTSPVHSGSSSARAWRSSFLLLAAHGFLTSSSFPRGETAAVNGASAPHFRPRDHEMGTMVLPLFPGTSSVSSLEPISLSAGAPLGTSKWEKFHPLEPKVCPKVSSAFPRVRTAEQRRSQPRRNSCRQKRCALAPTPPSASASLSPSLVSPCRTDQ